MNTTIILSVIFLGIGFLGICITILLQKNGEFSGTCASNNPLLNKKGEKCGYCGADPDEGCRKEENSAEK